ncbi:ATP-dependent DNA helicase II subunit 2 [Venturia nashicola]|uniref:ATP-dependent DNA helicase II subunit 2 n=1 Tax=Venturia nashicola TaxID=86259 RepID=A0A4Z1P7U5_9PEZI|nr:ATP-dependent DNA helicase II subunit 2 [Venturia nashicola]
MAEKEATVYIVDVGKSMGRKNQGREQTDLDWALQYVWDKITTTVETARKTAGVGVVALRSDVSNNELDAEEGYENINVLQDIKQTLMGDLHSLRDELKLSRTNKGDGIAAIVVAMQMITKHCKKLKFTRKIVLVTDAMNPMDHDDNKDIVRQLKEDNIQLVVLGVDFNDAEFGFKEEDKDPVKAENEKQLRELVEACDGQFGTMAEAIAEMGIPRLKSTRPTHSYKSLLTLGLPAKYDSAMAIDVERYPRTRVAAAPTASKHVESANMAPGPSQAQASGAGEDVEMGGTGDNNLVTVKNARDYWVEDTDAPGGKKDVPREDLVKGYEYGRTAVFISESDQNVTQMEVSAGLDIIGFIPMNKYELHMNMSDTNVIIGNKVNDKAKMALSSFIWALQELETYAIARFVPKDNYAKGPVIVLLAPEIEGDHECLIDVELPFAEDIRSYVFPPLDKIVTVGGKELKQHRNLPNDDLIKSMGEYMDDMDISTFEDGSEYAPIEDTFSLKVHRLKAAIKFRALNKIDEVPPPAPILLKYSNPPEELVTKAQESLEAVIKAADVKKVPPKQKGRKRTREIDKPLSGLNVEELLGREKRSRISADNAIPEFKQILSTTEDMSQIRDAVNQMSAIVQTYIRHSVGSGAYARAVEAIRIIKEEMVEFELPSYFNDFIRELKKKIVGGELGGDRSEMWYNIRVNKLGLIDNKLSELSDVTPEEARTFAFTK